MSDKPLDWLDNGEEYIKKHINRDFRAKVNLLENLINLVAGYVHEILNELPRFKDMEDLKCSTDVDRLRRIVSGVLLQESVERLYASRRMLLSGYQGRMLACLRDMWEAVYYSDICLQSEVMSRKWLDGKYLPKPKEVPENVEINNRVQKYREGESWKFLSSSGVHPTRIARERSILYKVPVSASLSTEAEVMFKNTRQVHKFEKEQTYINIWVAVFAAHYFLEYLRDIYPSIYKNNSLILSDLNKLDKRFWKNVVILGRQLRGK